MIPTNVWGIGPPLLLMHLNAKGAPNPLPVTTVLPIMLKEIELQVLNTRVYTINKHKP